MSENIAVDFEKSLEEEANSPVFKGGLRIFFITLAVALLMQGLSFSAMQVTNAKNVLVKDFKILLTLDKPGAELVNEIGSSLSSAAGVTSLKFISAEDAFELLKSSKPEVAQNFVFLNKNPMPEYFEVKLTPLALANIEPWLSDNVYAPYPAVRAHYKPASAKLISYTAAAALFLNLLSIITLALMAAFVFFVEAYYTDSECRRAGGITVSAFAYGVSAVIVFLLAGPLTALGGEYWAFTTPARQAAIALATVLLGWTFAKWKKF